MWFRTFPCRGILLLCNISFNVGQPLTSNGLIGQAPQELPGRTHFGRPVGGKTDHRVSLKVIFRFGLTKRP